MVRLGELMMILELHRQGVSITAIARRTGRDPKTVRKYIERGIEAPVYGPRAIGRPIRASIGSLPQSVLVVAAGADLQNPALDHDRPSATMSLDKGIPHSDSLAKYAVAFLRNSHFRCS